MGPLGVLAGAWLNSRLSERATAVSREEGAREAALRALARMQTILVDAQPSLIMSNDLREYSSPEKAVEGLHRRWVRDREAFMELWLTHPLPEVRKLAFDVQ